MHSFRVASYRRRSSQLSAIDFTHRVSGHIYVIRFLQQLSHVGEVIDYPRYEGAVLRNLITALRGEFDCIARDTVPLLPVVDALVVTTIAEAVFMVVEWSQTARASISEVFRSVSASCLDSDMLLVLTPWGHLVRSITRTLHDRLEAHARAVSWAEPDPSASRRISFFNVFLPNKRCSSRTWCCSVR